MGFAVTTRALATPSAQHESVREENNGGGVYLLRFREPRPRAYTDI